MRALLQEERQGIAVPLQDRRGPLCSGSRGGAIGQSIGIPRSAAHTRNRLRWGGNRCEGLLGRLDLHIERIRGQGQGFFDDGDADTGVIVDVIVIIRVGVGVVGDGDARVSSGGVGGAGTGTRTGRGDGVGE
jgi:hypothetical protein